MSPNLFLGQHTRLAAADPELHAPLIAGWSRDPEFLTLLSSASARPWTAAAVKKELEEDLEGDEPKANHFTFAIQTLPLEGQPARLIGLLVLRLDHWSHREAWLSIGIGERADWGRGYGSDSLRLGLRYAFDELNLHRVSLTVFEYNERALHTYRKLGFVEEGRQRQQLLRFGKRWDMVVMGLVKQS